MEGAMKCFNSTHGFTLIDLLIVGAILSLIAVCFAPVFIKYLRKDTDEAPRTGTVVKEVFDQHGCSDVVEEGVLGIEDGVHQDSVPSADILQSFFDV